MSSWLVAALFGASCVLASEPPATGDAPGSDAGTLGVVRVTAWSGAPRMPHIPLTRGPLQQIIGSLRPESLQPDARAWEVEITRHRRMVRAGEESMRSLEAHFEHELLLRSGSTAGLERDREAARQRLRARLTEEARERRDRLALRESRLLPALERGSRVDDRGTATALLLRAEIMFARERSTAARLAARYARDLEAWERGERDARPGEPRRWLEPVVETLRRVLRVAPDRNTRERAAQLMSLAQQEAGDLDGAATTLQAALEAGVGFELRGALRNRLGDVLLAMGRLAGAAREYGAVPEDDPGFWRASLGLAWCRHRQGNDAGALEAVTRVREQLRGLFDGAARSLADEADRLLVHLLADGVSLPDGLPEHLGAAVEGLRARQVEVIGTTSPTLGRVAARAPRLRDCYRDWLRRGNNGALRAVVIVAPGKNPDLTGLQTAPDLAACLVQKLDGMRVSERQGVGVIGLHLLPEQRAR